MKDIYGRKNSYSRFVALFIAIFAMAFTVMPVAANADWWYGSNYVNYVKYPDQISSPPGSTTYRPTYTQPVVVSQPVYYPTPQPVYYPTYYPAPQPVYYPINYATVHVSCSPSTYSTNVGSSVTWTAYPSGGNGSYTYSWSGTDSLYGGGVSVGKTYFSAGSKYATVTVYSAGQAVTQSCSGAINVYSGYSSYNGYNYYPNYYPSLNVSCSANTSYSYIGSPVVWTVAVTGGNGFYNYVWNGTDGLSGTARSISFNYSSPGTKTAQVTVYSDGHAYTSNCGTTVNVDGLSYGSSYVTSYATTPAYVSSNASNLDIGCYVDPTTVSVNQPVTWSVEVTGGAAPYRYSWTGSDGLSGTQSSVIKYYSTTGSKNAIVTVTGADGSTGTRACSNSVTVKGSYQVSTSAPKSKSAPSSSSSSSSEIRYTLPLVQNTTIIQTAPGQNPSVTVQSRPASSQVSSVGEVVTQTPMNSQQYQSASSLFSISNVPWGLIAVLVILVLFATVMYLIFNRSKM